MYTINERVKIIRNRLNYTQGEVAEQLGIKLSTYSQNERQGKLSGELLVKLADLFEVDVKCFLYDNTDIPTKTVIKEEGYILNNKEIALLTIYRNLSKKNQKEIFTFSYNLFKEKHHDASK